MSNRQEWSFAAPVMKGLNQLGQANLPGVDWVGAVSASRRGRRGRGGCKPLRWAGAW